MTLFSGTVFGRTSGVRRHRDLALSARVPPDDALIRSQDLVVSLDRLHGRSTRPLLDMTDDCSDSVPCPSGDISHPFGNPAADGTRTE